MCCEHTFLQALHHRGLRLTPQREMVLSALHDIEGHATAEEILKRVATVYPSIDISTVYRTLELLANLQLVGSIESNGQRRYELLSVHGPHHHLQCRACGRLLRIEAQEMQPLVEHLADVSGFAAEPDHLIIPGLCEACRQKTTAS